MARSGDTNLDAIMATMACTISEKILGKDFACCDYHRALSMSLMAEKLKAKLHKDELQHLETDLVRALELVNSK